MDREVWEKVLDEIRNWHRPLTLMTHGAGEPLLYKNLPELLYKAKQIPFLSVGFMCNGMLLNEKCISDLLEMQVDWLALSIDGINPQTHDFFRVNADLEHIEKNLHRLIEMKQQRNSRLPALFFNMVAYPEIADQSEDYVMKWLPYAESVMISAFRPVGIKKLWEGEPRFPFRPCPLLRRQAVISWDGQMGLCCEDINLDVPLGSIRSNSIADIFNQSPKLTAYRRLHDEKKIDRLALCSDCHVWGGDILLEKNVIHIGNMKVEKTVTPAYQLYKKTD